MTINEWVVWERLTGNGISGGDEEFAFGADEALVAVGAVAVADVLGHRCSQGVPAGVVGVVDDELARSVSRCDLRMVSNELRVTCML
jgi:hypothetical protein